MPIGLTIVAEAGDIAVTFLIGLFGTAGLAAAAITNQLAAVFFMVPIAVAGPARSGSVTPAPATGPT